MTIRKVFKWAVLLLVLIAALGAWFVHDTWQKRDELLLQGIRRGIANKTPPEWHVDVKEAHLDRRGQIRLRDIHLRPIGETSDVVYIPECFLTVDLDLLLEHQRVVVRHVSVREPTLTLLRRADGRWNWQALGRPQPSDQTPEVEIRGGTVIVQTEASQGMPAVEVASRSMDMRLVPSGQKRYVIEGASQIDGAGALAFRGNVDLNSGAWDLSGQAEGIDTADGLFEKAAALSPDVHRQFAELSQPHTVTPGATPVAEAASFGGQAGGLPHDSVRPANHSRPAEPSASQLRLPDLGLSASIGIGFGLSSDGRQTIPDFRVVATVYNGRLTEPLSPVPLEGLEGRVLVENDRVLIDRLRASNGDSELRLSGELRKSETGIDRDFHIVATNLYLDREVRSLLSPGGRKLFDLINPSGLFTIKARFHSDGVNPPHIELDEFTALDCQITHAMFRYPVTKVAGSITQSEQTLTINLTGEAAQRPVTITGRVAGLGPEAEAEINIATTRFPIDDRFAAALVDERHTGVRQALEALRLRGLADLNARFSRPAGPNQRYTMALIAEVAHGSLNFVRFPYEVRDLSGRVEYDAQKRKVWLFHDLKGRHVGQALQTPIRGEGTFDMSRPPGRLDLQLAAADVPLDDDLLLATVTADPDMQFAWDELVPRGRLQLEKIHVNWVPGSPPDIVLPTIHVEEGRLRLSSFPFFWDRIKADVGWDGSRVTIIEAEGWHNETYAHIEGRPREAPAFFDLHPSGDADWQLRLPNVTVSNLDPGSELRQALPADIGAVLGQIDPRGPVDLEHLALEMKSFPARGGSPAGTTSDCRWRTRFAKDGLSLGLDLTNVTGSASVSLQWDLQQVRGGGHVDFDEATALGMTFTDIHVPFRVLGDQVIAGDPAGLEPRAQQQPRATVYGGVIALDAMARLNAAVPEQSTYRAHVSFADADLTAWAKEMDFDTRSSSGTVSGELNLYGMGTSARSLRGDECWVQITDARLGELPVVAQIFQQLLDPRKRDKTAFKYAYLECSIHDGLFDFGSVRSRDARDSRRIQLAGGVLNMGGHGYVPFYPDMNQPMELDLYSKMDQRFLGFLRLPIVNAVSDNWIHVIVTGTPNDPIIDTRTEVPIVNDVLRGFFGTIEQGLAPVLPRPVRRPSRRTPNRRPL